MAGIRSNSNILADETPEPKGGQRISAWREAISSELGAGEKVSATAIINPIASAETRAEMTMDMTDGFDDGPEV